LNTYHYVLYIHLLSLFVGIGAGSVLLTCLFQLRAARTLEQAVPWGIVSGKVARLFPVAILGLFGTGAYMTSETTFPWTWSTRWIEIGIAGLVVLTVQGAGVAELTGQVGGVEEGLAVAGIRGSSLRLPAPDEQCEAAGIVGVRPGDVEEFEGRRRHAMGRILSPPG